MSTHVSATLAVLSLAAVLVLGACSGATQSPQPDPMPANRASDMPAQRPGQADVESVDPATRTDRDAIAAAVIALDRLAKVSLGAAGDCGLAASMIDDQVRADHALWAHLSEMSRDAEREKLLGQAQDDIAAGMERFADALGPCAFDRRVRSSLEGLVVAN